MPHKSNKHSVFAPIRIPFCGKRCLKKFAPFVFVALLGSTIFATIHTAFSWFDPSWRHRKAIFVRGSGTEHSNYQLLIQDIDAAQLYEMGKLQSDCADLRFTDERGHLLRFWVEDEGQSSDITDCTGGWGTISVWIQVPSLPEDGMTIYMYYGNPNTSSWESPYDIFSFFEDFTSASYGRVSWSGTGEYRFENGNFFIDTGSVYTMFPVSEQTRGQIIEMRASYHDFTAPEGAGLCAYLVEESTNMPHKPRNLSCNISEQYDSTTTVAYGKKTTGQGSFSKEVYSAYSVDTPYILSIEFHGDHMEYVTYDSEYSVLGKATIPHSWNTSYHISLGSWRAIAAEDVYIDPLSIDWVRVRQYIPHAPTPSYDEFGFEERRFLFF